MIVVESCDGTGKTTLVNHLADKYGLEVGKRGVANRDELYKVTRQDTYRALSNAVLGKSAPEIYDRLFVSEFVYADIVGRPNEFSEYEMHYVVRILNSLGCPVIACLPPFDVVAENAARAHQMAGVNDNLAKIYARYAHDDLPWPEGVLWYDYTGSNPNFASLADIEEEIEGYLAERKGREAWA